MIDDTDGETQGLSLKRDKERKLERKLITANVVLEREPITDDISSQMVDIQYTHIYVHILNTCAS